MTLGVKTNRLAELEELEARFEAVIAEVTRALKHRQTGWQPADPERLALGLQMSREGKVIKADEARARFRRTTG